MTKEAQQSIEKALFEAGYYLEGNYIKPFTVDDLPFGDIEEEEQEC